MKASELILLLAKLSRGRADEVEVVVQLPGGNTCSPHAVIHRTDDYGKGDYNVGIVVLKI